MKLPAIRGIIRRRILVNFRVDPEVMQAQLPGPFTPKLYAGFAIAGICLIRLEQIRPMFLPRFLGISSENAAHRVAVRWDDATGPREGVYIPRRDTGSWLNHLAGGRLFPGEHHLAHFNVQAAGDAIDLEMESHDGAIALRLHATPATSLPESSGFATREDASAFFEGGSLGYSVTRDAHLFDGITLRTEQWSLEPLNVTDVYLSYFSDETKFPRGSVQFDCALLMRDLAHEWHPAPELSVEP